MAKTRPSVFIGSSVEGLKIAEVMQLLLDRSCEVTIWSQGVFGLSSGTLESLVLVLNTFDFAILVLTPDDLVTSKETEKDVPRDNVLFELGLFMGRLGRERTFIVYNRTNEIRLPTDLAGVTPATFEPHSSGNLESALGAPSTQIKNLINKIGPVPREEHKATATIALGDIPKTNVKNDIVTFFFEGIYNGLLDMDSHIKPDRKSRWAGTDGCRYYHLWYKDAPWVRREVCYKILFYADKKRFQIFLFLKNENLEKHGIDLEGVDKILGGVQGFTYQKRKRDRKLFISEVNGELTIETQKQVLDKLQTLIKATAVPLKKLFLQ